MKKRTVSRLVVGVIFLLACSTLWAISNPIVYGSVLGIELCPQFICHAAIFTGGFSGRIGNNFNAQGIITAALNHEELPLTGACSEITGGSWELRTLFRRVYGTVENHGLICNPTGDGTFTISATLDVGNGSGTIQFAGFLSHQTFPPTFGGTLSQ